MYPLKFKAAVLRKISEPLTIEEITFKGPLQRGQILVKLLFTGICGKQIEEIDEKGQPDKFLPHLLGHEGTATIIDTGSGVDKDIIGKTAVLHWMKGDGIQSSTPIYFDKQNKKINAGWVTTFNEYAVVSQNRVTVIDSKKNLDQNALFGCAASTGLGISFNQVKITKKDTVLVVGCGGVGLSLIQGLTLFHPSKIIAADISNSALRLAKKCGATHFLNTKNKDFRKKFFEITSSIGASKVFIVTGNIEAIQSSIELCQVPGECYQVGVPEFGKKISIDAFSLMHGRNLFGSMGGQINPNRDIPKFIRLNNTGKINIENLITKRYKFKNINKGIEYMRSSKGGRVMVKF
ncbi:zinc-binding dehydrogenase [Gammaproteobacteria bacterium]|nr:zinc-binding dehydrogenase [Gammaproteobacteria bacterium]